MNQYQACLLLALLVGCTQSRPPLEAGEFAPEVQDAFVKDTQAGDARATDGPALANDAGTSSTSALDGGSSCRASLVDADGGWTFPGCPNAVVDPADTPFKVQEGQSVSIKVNDIAATSGNFVVEVVGGAGAAGSPGASGGEWSSQGDGDYWEARRACEADQTPANNGQQGGPGGTGGNSGDVHLDCLLKDYKIIDWTPQLKKIELKPGWEVELRGGPGGPGGPGGQGKLLKNGRQNYCDGCMYHCRSGPPGNTGPLGNAGKLLVEGKPFDEASGGKLKGSPKTCN